MVNKNKKNRTPSKTLNIHKSHFCEYRAAGHCFKIASQFDSFLIFVLYTNKNLN